MSVKINKSLLCRRCQSFFRKMPTKIDWNCFIKNRLLAKVVTKINQLFTTVKRFHRMKLDKMPTVGLSIVWRKVLQKTMI